MADAASTTRKASTEDLATSSEWDVTPSGNRVQFGPVVVGVLTALATLLILTVLGLGVGASALEPRDAGETPSTAAEIWGAVSAIIAFFLGGWIAARTAAVGGVGNGTVNGLVVGAAILPTIVVFAGSDVTGLLGPLGGDISAIIDVAQNGERVMHPAVQQIEQSYSQAAFDSVEDDAWSTLLGMILPLVAAALGGMIGHHRQGDAARPHSG